MGIDINNEVILTEKLDDLATSNVDLAVLNEQFDANNSMILKSKKQRRIKTFTFKIRAF